MSNDKTDIFWFRRDLRLDDNTGLTEALKSGRPVIPLFIFDKAILDELEDKSDRRVNFIHQALERLNKELKKHGSSLLCIHGHVPEVFENLTKDREISAVCCNHDYEPYARERDAKVAALLKLKDVEFHSYKDQVIFEKNEILKADGSPYTVFTPYSKAWKRLYRENKAEKANFANLEQNAQRTIPSLQKTGFESSGELFAEAEINKETIREYDKYRNDLAADKTSRLSVHLRFGTISIRELTKIAAAESEVYLNELIWRDFFFSILWHFPQVTERSFKAKYDSIRWRNNEEEFKAWCMGMTGYPIVDAGMRQLLQTGFMHNRVRMVCASFLVKHLLIDWRWGEAWFAEKLLDFDLAANNGNWQWAAGSGCDAAPYFRVFNPYEQAKRFDPQGKYVRKWIRELSSVDYPSAIVEHSFARQRALDTYKKALS